MAFNPFDQALFDVRAPCMPCCAQTECACALVLPPGNIGGPSVYASYSDAFNALNDFTADCLVYAFASDTLASLSAAFDGTTLSIAGEDDASGGGADIELYVSVSALGGSTLSVDYIAAFTGDGSDPEIGFVLYDCNWNQIDNQTASDLSGTFSSAIPSDGVYYLYLPATASDPTSAALAADITCDDVFVPNPVIALWDDSGTTRQLEACPKLYLPILTESSGDWYASCADAADDITNKSSNCVGYATKTGGSADTVDLVATDGGDSLALQITISPAGPGGYFGYGSVNAEAGETLIAAGSNNGSGATNTVLVVYDYTGAEIGTFVGLAGADAVSSALPYTGRYIVNAYNANTGEDGTVFTTTVTSSGTMSVNQIQALYDVGLDCPARLNCGDSCP